MLNLNFLKDYIKRFYKRCIQSKSYNDSDNGNDNDGSYYDFDCDCSCDE